MAELEMLNDYVLMRRDKLEERKSPGGIVLPSGAGDKPTYGTVLGVGPKASASVRIGDRVLVSKFAGAEVIADDGEPAVVVRLDDVYGVKHIGG